MSDELQKNKHQKRIQKTINHINKQVNIAKSYGYGVDTPHKYHKHNYMDCGNPKCIVCGNPRKMWNEPTIQEKSFFQKKIIDTI